MKNPFHKCEVDIYVLNCDYRSAELTEDFSSVSQYY